VKLCQPSGPQPAPRNSSLIRLFFRLFDPFSSDLKPHLNWTATGTVWFGDERKNTVSVVQVKVQMVIVEKYRK